MNATDRTATIGATRASRSMGLGVALALLLMAACTSGSGTTDSASPAGASPSSETSGPPTPRPEAAKPVCSKATFTRLLEEGFSATHAECAGGWARVDYEGNDSEGWVLFEASGSTWKKAAQGGGPVSDAELEAKGVPASVAKKLCVICSSTDPLALEDGRYPVMIETIDVAGNKLTFDLIQWFSGNAADRAAREDGVIGPGEHIENGIYSRNDSKQLRTFDVAPGAPVTVVWWQREMDPEGAKVITLAQLYNVFHGSASWQEADTGMYWITVAGGKITQLKGQYTP